MILKFRIWATNSSTAFLNINPLIILDYGNKNYDNGQKPLSEDAIKGFSNYANFLSSYFKGKVKIYEIWNKWGGGAVHNPGTFEYLNLVKHVYAVIKAVNPWTQGVGTWGNNQKYGRRSSSKAVKTWRLSTVVMVCHYILTTIVKKIIRLNKSWYKWMNRLITSLKNSNLQVPPIYITEMGWPTSMGQCGIYC